MLEFAPLVAFAALGSQFVAFIKFLFAKDKNGVVTTLVVWLAGVLTVFLFAQSDFAAAIPIGDVTLDGLNGWSLVIAGLTVGGVGSTVYNFKKALDGSDSAKEPPLIK